MASPRDCAAQGASFRLPYHPEVRERDMGLAAEIWSEQAARLAEERGKELAAVQLRRQRGRAARRKAVGRGLFAVKQEQRRLLAEAAARPRLAGSRARRSLAGPLRRVMGGEGIEPGQLKVGAERYLDAATLWNHSNLWDMRFKPHDWDLYVEPPPPPPERNPWQTFAPPFSGWQSGVGHGAVSGFRTNRVELLNPAAGHVGNILSVDCDAATDLDVGSIVADTQVAFWYHAPIAGLVEVVIEAVCGEARHELRVMDEWGVSDMSMAQLNFLMMHVIHPSVRAPTLGLVTELRHAGDNSTFRDERPVASGTVIVTGSFFSDGPVAANEWVVVRAGCHSHNGAITNDMEVHSILTASWFLRRIFVRIHE